MSTAARAEKIAALRARLQQLEAAEKAATARARAVAAGRARAEDTRRKVLAGAFVIDQLTLAEVAALELRGVRLSAWLTRPADRALFGLACEAVGTASAVPSAARDSSSLPGE